MQRRECGLVHREEAEQSEWVKGREALSGEGKERTGFKAAPGPGYEGLTGRTQGNKTSAHKVLSGAATWEISQPPSEFLRVTGMLEMLFSVHMQICLSFQHAPVFFPLCEMSERKHVMIACWQDKKKTLWNKFLLAILKDTTHKDSQRGNIVAQRGKIELRHNYKATILSCCVSALPSTQLEKHQVYCGFV